MKVLEKLGYIYFSADLWPQRMYFYLGKVRKIEIEDIQGWTDKYLEKIKKHILYKNFVNRLYHSGKLESVLRMNMEYFLLEKLIALNFPMSTELKKVCKKLYNYFPKKWLFDFVFNSNKIEGSKIPMYEVIKLLSNKKSEYNNLNEIKEVINTEIAWDQLSGRFVFNEIYIKKLYHTLTKGLYMSGNLLYPKGYKKNPVIVGNSETTAPDDVDSEMKKLLARHKENKSKLFPIQLALEFHLRFEKIHPFTDANGRIGRMLMNKLLVQHKFLPFVVFDENRKGYFQSFEKSSENIGKYYKFMVGQYEKTLANLNLGLS